MGTDLAFSLSGILLDGIEEVAEYDTAGTRAFGYLHDPSRVDAVLAQTGASGTTHYAVTDALGSVYALTDASGTTRSRYEYDAYGARSASVEGVATKWGFTGRVHEAGAPGAMYYRAREYDAAVGRFGQADPYNMGRRFVRVRSHRALGAERREDEPLLRGDTNLYAYVRGNPTGYVDPDGLYAEVIQCGNEVAIFIPITWLGPGADVDTVLRMTDAIETTWSGTFDQYHVTTLVTKGRWNDVWIQEDRPPGWRSSVTGKRHGLWTREDPTTTIAHEAGHLMGLEDWYPGDPGIMGTGGSPTGSDIFAILTSTHNNVLRFR